MNYKDEINKIDLVLSELKALKSDYIKAERLSSKSLETNFTNSTPKQIQKISADMNWHFMHLDKTKKRVWSAIENADLCVDLSETEYKPSAFHLYKS